jgi:hypothetical protein
MELKYNEIIGAIVKPDDTRRHTSRDIGMGCRKSNANRRTKKTEHSTSRRID